jgi:hypothetical protein
MNYLATTDYLTYGLEATTDPSWITAASAIIDAHCRRATLGVNQFEERLKLPPELNTVRLSYLPLVTVPPWLLRSSLCRDDTVFREGANGPSRS